MKKRRAFISFDYDHDSDLKTMLVGQARNEDSPFDIADHSIKEKLPGDWRSKARSRIKGCDVVIVVCGRHTASARGVAAELRIATEEDIEYFLLAGRADVECEKPTGVQLSDKMYKWTWQNLKALIHGRR